MNKRFFTVLSAVALALMPIGGAVASTASDTGKVNFTDEQLAQAAADGTILYGGHTQSVDPTRYDYVPAPSLRGGGVTPMSATGFTGIGGFIMSTGAGGASTNVQVPAGFLIHEISGSGTGASLGVESAYYTPAPSIAAVWNLQMCNWRFDWQERYGSSIIATSPGQTNTGCSILGTKVYRVDTALPAHAGNQLCARLYVGGSFRGQQCHNIKP